MREVTNIRRLERVLSEIVKDIADRYNIEPEVVCAVIEEYGKAMGKRLAKLIVVSEN